MLKYAIAWDIGHGFPDSGASGNGMIERALNEKVVAKAMALLEARGINQYLIHPASENPGLQTRAQRARDWGADLLISVHHNAGGGVGFEIYRSVHGTLDDRLADLIANEFTRIGQKPHGSGGGVYERILDTSGDYYGILRYSAELGIPAIISEFAYIDNAADADKINSEYKLQREAEALARAVCRLCDVPWDIKDDAQIVAEALVGKGWTNSPDYWIKVMRGQETPKAEYILKLLQKSVT